MAPPKLGYLRLPLNIIVPIYADCEKEKEEEEEEERHYDTWIGSIKTALDVYHIP
jgi:hypothetical protein